jgi:hypothetical protein
MFSQCLRNGCGRADTTARREIKRKEEAEEGRKREPL